MTLIPAFKIGVWNAWIPLLVSLIPVFFIPLISKYREKGVNFTAAFEWSSIVFWWVIVFVLLLILHIWLNRRALSSYFGRRWSTAIFALCCAAFASLIVGGLVG